MTTFEVATVRARTSRISQAVTLLAVVVPPLGLASAMGLLWGVAFHWLDFALFAGFYAVCAFGTTIGFHRYFTHRGFETRKPLEGLLASYRRGTELLQYCRSRLEAVEQQVKVLEDGQLRPWPQ